ncbi:unnamed protein product [Dovyalis caffra]|uniref:Uncharacterized protein n=1 Tax=Dovyalis caffra TaxID=77055 RepID=A0AAV1SEX8_9ROSI|nr:unnamed protein product [Dovyalis caffra]
MKTSDQATDLHGQSKSFVELFLQKARSAFTWKRSPYQHESMRSHCEAISKASKSSRPGGNSLHKAPAGVPSSSAVRSRSGFSRGGEEDEVTAPTEIPHHIRKEVKLKMLRQFSKIMELSDHQATALHGQSKSFAKFFLEHALSERSPHQHESMRSHREAISKASKSSRPGGNSLHKAPSGVPSSSAVRSRSGFSRGGEEHEVAVSTEIPHHTRKEDKVKILRKLSKQHPTSEVALKIAFFVESLNASNHITEEIIKKCKEGEQKLEDGLLLVKQAQQRLDLLLTEIYD